MNSAGRQFSIFWFWKIGARFSLSFKRPIVKKPKQLTSKKSLALFFYFINFWGKFHLKNRINIHNILRFSYVSLNCSGNTKKMKVIPCETDHISSFRAGILVRFPSRLHISRSAGPMNGLHVLVVGQNAKFVNFWPAAWRSLADSMSWLATFTGCFIHSLKATQRLTFLRRQLSKPKCQ